MAPIDNLLNVTAPQKVETQQQENKEGDSFNFAQEDYDNLYKAYVDFVNQEFDPLWNNYQLNDDYMVVRVFTFNPAEHREGYAPKIYLGRNDEGVDRHLMTFPVGIVLAAGAKATYVDEKGEEHRYKQGDFVKLRDEDARVITNPDWEGWMNNQMEKSNAKKLGDAPPQRTSNLRRRFSKYMTKSNPFDLYLRKEDLFTFDMPRAMVEGRIKDPNAFIA